jgi:hypothetical protein
MDPKQFDRLARIVGSGSSRRTVLKTLAGGTFALATAVGLNNADAAAPRSAGNSCTSNADCASHLCVQESRTRKICHCASANDCPASNGLCQASACLPNGSCSSTSVVCQPLDQCHVAGTCNPATGICSNPVAPIGIGCDDGNPCTISDSCQANGTCVGVPKNCADGNACTTDTCDGASGNCVHAPISCPSGLCDSGAGCVECLFDSDCPPTGNECVAPTCANHVCTTTNLDQSHTLSTGQTPGNCQKLVCNGQGGVTSIDDPTDLPTSTSACLINPACTGEPLAQSFANAATGTPCSDNGGLLCLNGACVACYPIGTPTVCGSYPYTECCSGNCYNGACQQP